jgi:hypothetical protein
MEKIVDYNFEMILKMRADREETEEELEKNERDFVRNLSCPDRFGSDADTETKHAFFAYEFGLDEDEVNGPPGEVCFYFSKQRNLLLIDHMLLLFKIQD